MFAAAKIGDVERCILSDLGYPQPPTLILCDNECAVGLAQRTMVPKLPKSSIDMRFHWIQDRIKQLQFLVQHVAGANNVADFFTKSLPRAKHDQFAPYCDMIQLLLLHEFLASILFCHYILLYTIIIASECLDTIVSCIMLIYLFIVN